MKRFSLLIILLFTINLHAQVPIPVFDHKPAIGKELILKSRVLITVDRGDSIALGTGVIICPRNKDGTWNILTAYHVTSKHQMGYLPNGSLIIVGYIPVKDVILETHDKSKIKAKLISYDEKSDLAWLRTYSDNHDVECAVLAKKSPNTNVRVRHKGFGGDVWRRGTVKSSTLGMQALNIMAVRGDSGGGVFDEDTDEVIGIMSTSNFVGNATIGSCEAAWKIKPIDNNIPKRDNKREGFKFPSPRFLTPQRH